MIPPLRPKVELLGRDYVEKVIDEALGLLEREGVFVENAEARALFREAGTAADEASQRVRIPTRMVEEALASTPAAIVLSDRAGSREFTVGGDEVHFDPGSTATRVLDGATQRERKAATEDVVRLARLTDACEHIHFQSTALISADVPEIVSDSYRLYLGLLYSGKPVVTGTFRTAGFKPMLDMLIAVRGGAEALRRRPLAIFDACPSPPLKWSHLTAQSLIDSARAGLPSELISMSLTGATAPVTLGGALVQHTAENLSGLVICQLARKGAPVIFGGSPASFDMRKGTTPMGAMETMMIDMAYAQIGKHLKLPTHAYMGLSDAKIQDAQSGFETGMGAVLAALAGINVISGPGMMDFESTQSPEKLLVDNDICGMVYRLLEGVAQREDPLAAHLFDGIRPDTQFLTMPHTRKWYRIEHRMANLADRDTYDAWEGAGRKSIGDRAAEQARALLKSVPPNLPDPALQRELRAIMEADARSNGAAGLPGLP
jgi:trimethylamine--corrinoid protein Co-methyltransferase